MKIYKYLVLGTVMVAAVCGCSKQEIGYLQADNAIYVPATMDIRLVLDEKLDAYRIYNVSPWVSPLMQGVVGTNPIKYTVERVTSEKGNADMFRSLLKLRGGGRMEFPLISDIPVGEYLVSIRLTNEGHSRVVEDAFTFVVK